MNPFPWKIIQTSSVLAMLFEGNIHSYRQVFLDGRGHPKDLDPSWYGHSVGTWDGDTLVIESSGFNDKFWFDGRGHPHTTQLKVIERFRRRDLGNMDQEISIIDPGTYTKPWNLKRTVALFANGEIQFTGGDPGIRQSLGRMYREEGVERASRGAVSTDLAAYVGRALSAVEE